MFWLKVGKDPRKDKNNPYIAYIIGYNEVRKALGIDNSWIADKLGFKTKKTYQNSTAKKRFDNLIVELYKKFKEKDNG